MVNFILYLFSRFLWVLYHLEAIFRPPPMASKINSVMSSSVPTLQNCQILAPHCVMEAHQNQTRQSLWGIHESKMGQGMYLTHTETKSLKKMPYPNLLQFQFGPYFEALLDPYRWNCLCTQKPCQKSQRNLFPTRILMLSDRMKNIIIAILSRHF